MELNLQKKTEIMKLKKIMLMSMISTTLLLGSCSEPIPSIDADRFMYLFLMGAKELPSVKKLNLESMADTTFYITLAYGGTTNYDQGDISATLAADLSLVEAFNTANYTTYLPLPEDARTFDKTEIRIPNGKNMSEEPIKLTIRMSAIDLSIDYILPVTVRSVSGSVLPLNEELKTLYLVFQGDVDEDKGKSRWHTTGVSSEWQQTYVAALAFDDDRSTYWHSDAAGSMPQWFSVNMEGFKRLDGFTWVNRTDPTQNALPKHVKLETSRNGTEWTEALNIPEMEQSRVLQVFPLGRTVVAKHFRVTVLSTWDNAPYTYVGEVDIYSGEAPESEQDIKKYNWTIVDSHADWNADWPASRAIDGNPNTTWHTHLVGDYPYWFIVDFHQPLKINGILFQNRLDDASATNFPKHVKWEASDDLQTWTTILELDELPAEKTEQRLPCTNVTTARYLRFSIYNGWTGGDWTFVGEMSIY
jgi:hypothetical protein